VVAERPFDFNSLLSINEIPLFTSCPNTGNNSVEFRQMENFSLARFGRKPRFCVIYEASFVKKSVFAF